MKNLHISLFLFVFLALIGTNVDGMKRQRESEVPEKKDCPNEETITLKCRNEDGFINISKGLIKYSASLSNYFTNSQASSLVLVKSDFVVLRAIVDCIEIIDSEDNPEQFLLNYLYDFVNSDEGLKLKDFVQAGYSFDIKPLTDAFKIYTKFEYEKKLDDVTQKALAVFEKIEDKEKSAIIIDIDDTALSRIDSPGKIKVNGIEANIPYLLAIDKVHALYRDLVKMKFKIFFLTARAEKNLPWLASDYYDATVQNLVSEGYDTFEKVICTPYKTRMHIQEQANGNVDLEVDLLANWKESERNKIAEKFTVAGTLDDTEENLKGSNVGYPVLIPRLIKFC